MKYRLLSSIRSPPDAKKAVGSRKFGAVNVPGDGDLAVADDANKLDFLSVVRRFCTARHRPNNPVIPPNHQPRRAINVNIRLGLVNFLVGVVNVIAYVDQAHIRERMARRMLGEFERDCALYVGLGDRRCAVNRRVSPPVFCKASGARLLRVRTCFARIEAPASR